MYICLHFFLIISPLTFYTVSVCYMRLLSSSYFFLPFFFFPLISRRDSCGQQCGIKIKTYGKTNLFLTKCIDTRLFSEYFAQYYFFSQANGIVYFFKGNSVAFIFICLFPSLQFFRKKKKNIAVHAVKINTWHSINKL